MKNLQKNRAALVVALLLGTVTGAAMAALPSGCQWAGGGNMRCDTNGDGLFIYCDIGITKCSTKPF